MSETRKAGRELDVEIAEKVMGATWRPVPDDMAYREREWLQFNDAGVVLAWRYDDGRPDVQKGSLPCYSTDIAAVWEVVEEMARRGWVIDVQNRQLTRWACHVAFPAPNYATVFECEDTAPLAICRAALAAVAASTPTPEG